MVLRATKPEFNTRSSLRESPYKEIDPSIDYSVTKDPGIRTGKNMVINGCMRIAQRASTYTPTSSGFGSLDRWKAIISNASKISITHKSDGEIPGNLSSYYTRLQVAAAYTVGSSEYFLFWQPIEGNIFSQTQFGSEEAKPLTLSFWVRTNAPGKFGGSLENAAQNRAFPFSVDIEAINEWEYKTVHIPPCRDGTWNTNANAGCYLMFSMGNTIAGGLSNYDWQGAQRLGPVEEVRRVELFTSTYVDITGVQLEIGTEATPFDYRSYGEELALCQRYYMKRNMYGVCSTGFSQSGGGYNSHLMNIPLPCKMRATPTVTFDNGTQSGAFQPGGDTAAFASFANGEDFVSVTTGSTNSTWTTQVVSNGGIYINLTSEL